MNSPKWIQLQLTEKCNLNCTMCYERNSDAYRNEAVELDINALYRVVEECAQYLPHYELFGGEPLMYSNLESLLNYIHKTGSKVTIPTNGMLLAKKSGILVGKSVEKVWVSLDGPPMINDKQRGSNAYKTAIKGIIALYDERAKQTSGLSPRIGVHCVVTAHNYRYLEQLLNDPVLFEHVDDFSFELQKYLLPHQYERYTKIIGKKDARFAQGYVQEVSDFSAIDFKILDSLLNKIQQMCNEKGKGFFTNPDKLCLSDIEHYFTGNWEKMSVAHKSCIFPFIYAEITARGNVVLCHSFYDDFLGNINQESFLQIWNNTKAKEFRKSIRKELLPVCYACCSYFNSENRV